MRVVDIVMVAIDKKISDELGTVDVVGIYDIVVVLPCLEGIGVDNLSTFLVVRECGNMVVEDGLKSIGVGAPVTFFVVGMPVIVVVLLRCNGLSVDELDDFAILE